MGKMRGKKSIKALYVLALAEGEGVGTAYEYYAKRLALLPWLAKDDSPRTMLVAGLPEKYGSSLDFLLLGAEMGSQITVVDDRPNALRKLSDALDALKSQRYAPALRPQLCLTSDLSAIAELNGRFDLVVSSEVLQRLDAGQRQAYVRRTRQLAARVALFMPNADNDAHVGLSGLNGLHLEELQMLVEQNTPSPARTNYIDMPPFPPGISRTSDQREEATSGKVEAFAMWGLGIYAQLEKWIPESIRRKWAHIVFAFLGPDHR